MAALVWLIALLVPTALPTPGGAAVGPRGRGGRAVLCYFEGASAVRPQEEARFAPEDMDVEVCTHVVFNRAEVTRGLEVVPRDRATDLMDDGGKGLYNRTLKLKELKPGLKVFIDVYDTSGEFRKQLTSGNSSALAQFARGAADYAQAHGFDGMNIRTTMNSEGLDVVAPVLHDEFVRRGMQLMSILLPPDPRTDIKFEMTELLSRSFDLIVVASYWRLPTEQTEIFSSVADLETAVDEYTALGVPPEKLVVAIPAFSISLKICAGAEGGVGSQVCCGGDEGAYESIRMILHSSELMRKMANTSEGWVVVRDQPSRVLYGHSKSLQWASFEDPDSVRAKAAFILKRDMAGAAIMNVDMEDFSGAHSEGGVTFPLARAAFDALNGAP